MTRGLECCRLLFETVDRFREEANRHNNETPASSYGVTLGQLRVMKEISRCVENDFPDGVMLKVLAANVNLSPGAASIIVDSLVRIGMLERKTSPTDRRAIRIHLSSAGMKKVSRYMAFFTDAMENALKTIKEEDYQIFINVLTEMKSNLEKGVER